MKPYKGLPFLTGYLLAASLVMGAAAHWGAGMPWSMAVIFPAFAIFMLGGVWGMERSMNDDGKESRLSARRIVNAIIKDKLAQPKKPDGDAGETSVQCRRRP